jgi:ribonuclease PH
MKSPTNTIHIHDGNVGTNKKKTGSLLFQFDNKENICGINPIR